MQTEFYDRILKYEPVLKGIIKGMATPTTIVGIGIGLSWICQGIAQTNADNVLLGGLTAYYSADVLNSMQHF